MWKWQWNIQKVQQLPNESENRIAPKGITQIVIKFLKLFLSSFVCASLAMTKLLELISQNNKLSRWTKKILSCKRKQIHRVSYVLAPFNRQLRPTAHFSSNITFPLNGLSIQARYRLSELRQTSSDRSICLKRIWSNSLWLNTKTSQWKRPIPLPYRQQKVWLS